MDANQIFDEFTDAIGRLVIYARATRKLTRKEMEELNNQTDSYEKRKKENPNWFSSFDNMHYYNPKTDEHKTYYKCVDSLEDRKVKVWLHRNKNYQWLLAEAYEAYEIFLRKLYAYVGTLSPSNWPLSDFGNSRLSELDCKDYDWYEALAFKKRKDFPDSITKEFRKLRPDIDKYEKENSNRLNLRMVMKTIEKFRHLIVHQGGRVDDLSKLIEGINNACNIRNNSKEGQITKSYVESVIGRIDGKLNIVLLERNGSGLPSDLYHSRFETLIQYMVSYCSLLVEELATLDDKS